MDTSGVVKSGPLDAAMEQWAMSVWTADDSRSVIRLAPDCIQKAMLGLDDELKTADESEIKARVKRSSLRSFTATDNQLRLSFWLEYDRCQREMAPKMVLANIVRGIMATDYFLGTYLNFPLRVAYLTIPPKSYTVRLNEMLDVGLDQIRDVMELPHQTTNSKGQVFVNTKLLELKFKIMTYMDMRQHGAIAQRVQIEQKNLNVNMKGDAKDIMNAIEGRNMADIEKRLTDLRKKQLMIEKGVHPDKADTSTEAILVSDEGSKDGRKPESEEPV